MLSRYAGTRLGRQEIEGEVLDDVPGALWQAAWIDGARVQAAPELLRVVVAVDPAVTAGKGSDETGIVAAGAALIWSSYSVLCKRLASTRHAFPTAAIGTFGCVSGLLSLLCHVWLEPAVSLSARDMLLIAVLGLGPLGGAFFLWDAALKLGDARQIGVLSYLTPLLSTLLLLWVTGRPLSGSIALATALILGAAVVGTRAR
ncbi:MAG: EamA family transporter [Burkholderiales bacterium]|nr:EamA family transporter [Burkholderiales bacterium]